MWTSPRRSATQLTVYVTPVRVTPSAAGTCSPRPNSTRRVQARTCSASICHRLMSWSACTAVPEPDYVQPREIELSPDGQLVYVASAGTLVPGTRLLLSDYGLESPTAMLASSDGNISPAPRGSSGSPPQA